MKKSVIAILITSLIGSQIAPVMVLAVEVKNTASKPSTNTVNVTEPPLFAPQAIILPDMGEATTSSMTSLDEKRLGERIMREIRKDPDYSKDLVLYDYFNQIGKELVAAARRNRISGSDSSGPFGPKFEFFGVRDRTINAFALPGGYIGIHTGLLVTAETESELASVLGHEIGHVTQKHIARSSGQGGSSAFIILASILLAGLAIRNNASAAQGLAVGGQALAIQNQLSYSRDAEREADRVGLQILASSGFDINGMVGFFQRLQRANNIMDSGVPAYVRTHPLTIDRISDLQDRVRSMPQRKINSSLEFYLVQARAKLEQQGRYSELVETRQFFESLTQLNNPVKQMEGYYGLSILVLKENKLDEAEAMLKKSRDFAGRAGGGSPIIRTGLAFEITTSEIAMQRKHYDQAVAAAQQAIRLYPGSKAAGVAMVEAMLAAGKINDAVTWLKQKVRTTRDDADLWDLLARGYALQNKMAAHHAALAEKFALEGALPGAIEQLRIAKKEGGSDFYQLSEIEARMRTFESLYREERKDSERPEGGR